MRTRSIRFRLTAWYALILTAGLGLFGGLIWVSLRSRLIAEVDRDLDGRASRFEKFFRSESQEVVDAQLRDELDEFCQALPPGSTVDLRGSDGFAFRYVAGPPQPAGNLRTVRRQFTIDSRVFDLDAGAPIGDVLHTLDLLRLLLWSLLPVVIAIACIGGAWLSGRALRPVEDIAAAARTIGIENLSRRLPVPASGDELARLTEVLNTMFARLESAVKTLSQFVADASHELRTPLAVIRTNAELALRRERTPESYRESLAEIVGEAERMTRLVEDLLVLARTDTSVVEMPLERVDVRDIVNEVRSELRGLAELHRVRIPAIPSGQPAFIAGNRSGLRRLLLVVVDNGVKYSRPGGEVAVSVEHRGTQVSVAIRDSGCGIAEADLPHIFKRFYRADPARAGAGHGLGLSLAESIAKAHGAAIEVESRPGLGSTFRVIFRADPAEVTGAEVKSSFSESSA